MEFDQIQIPRICICICICKSKYVFDPSPLRGLCKGRPFPTFLNTQNANSGRGITYTCSFLWCELLTSVDFPFVSAAKWIPDMRTKAKFYWFTSPFSRPWGQISGSRIDHQRLWALLMFLIFLTRVIARFFSFGVTFARHRGLFNIAPGKSDWQFAKVICTWIFNDFFFWSYQPLTNVYLITKHKTWLVQVNGLRSSNMHCQI